jgi:2-iminobutanoate/2-iminopropanoate deaminase
MKDQAATIVLTKDAPSSTGPYVQGLAGAGLVFVSGQLPIRPDGTGLQDKGFDAQVRQALANVFAIVRAGGSAPERILKVTAFIVGAEHQPFNKIYAGRRSRSRHRALVEDTADTESKSDGRLRFAGCETKRSKPWLI